MATWRRDNPEYFRLRRLALRDLTQAADDDGLYESGTGFVDTR